MDKLFSARSIINNFKYKEKYYENVTLLWIVVERREIQLNMLQLVPSFDKLSMENKMQLENYVKESFLQDEIKQLRQYLQQRKVELIETSIDLPVGIDEQSRKSVALEPGMGFYPLHKDKGYSLPFKVEGFFNINYADEKIVPDNQKTLISKKIKVDELQKYIEEKGGYKDIDHQN